MPFCLKSLAAFPLSTDCPGALAAQLWLWLTRRCLQDLGSCFNCLLFGHHVEERKDPVSISGTLFKAQTQVEQLGTFQNKMKRPSSRKNLGSTAGKCPNKRIMRLWGILSRDSVESHYLVILMNKVQRFFCRIIDVKCCPEAEG